MATETAQIKVTADTSQAERALGALNNTLKGLATISAVVAFAKFADELTNMQNKLGQVTAAGQSSVDLFNVMAKSALNLGAPVKDVTELFYRLSINSKDLGLSQASVLQTTETLIKGFQLAGLSMNEARGATIQLGQAYASGVLRGDELNSVMEQLPAVAEALAVKFNVQRGALKSLGEQGRITSKDLDDAIKASGETINREWGNRIPTISQNFERLQTVVGVVTSRLDEQSGASRILSYALLLVAEAVIDVSEWFSKWGKWILYAAEAFAILYVPLRLARMTFALLIGPIEAIIGLFETGAGIVAGFGRAMVALGEYVSPITGPVTALGNSIAMLFGGIATGVSVVGVGKLAGGINELVGGDKQTAAEKMNKKIEELNKRLGLDSVEASNTAAEASKRASAQQIKDAEAIRKATQSRNEELRKTSEALDDNLKLTSFIGDAEAIESKILSTNRSLIKAIMNDKNEIIGYTKGLNVEEEKTMRLMLANLEIAKQQQALRGLTAPESTAGVTSRASSMFGGTQAGLGVEAERNKAAADLLKQNGLITEQAYSDQLLNIEKSRADAILALEQKTAENRLQIAGVTNAAIIQAVQAQQANVKMIQQGGVQGFQGMLGAIDNVMASMSTQNRKAFEAHKALATSQAIISTYQAAAEAIAFPPGPPLSFIYVAGAIAAGMAQVSAIQSQSYSGRALGGPVQGSTPYIVGERGPELFTPSTSGNITRNDQLGGGGATVNFNITANDAQGFDDLLIQRRGMITQFIRDAMAEQGQRSRM